MLSERGLTQKTTNCVIPEQAKLIHSAKNQNKDGLRAQNWGKAWRWESGGS